MRAISLFSGAGGLDLACESAGFATCAAVEWDDTARSTLIANRPAYFSDLEPEAIFGEISSVEPEDLLGAGNLEVGEADLLHGGPPCTPFSKSGYWLEYKRQGADPRASLLDEYVRLLNGTRPRSFLMENVYGLAYRNQNRPVFERFQRAVRLAGYSLDWRILLAADYGVPQLRQRLFCVGVRTDLLGERQAGWKMRWPEPSHSGPHETRKSWDTELLPHATSGEALAGLTPSENPSEPEEVVDGRYALELRGVPSGENYLFWTAERGHPRPRFKWRSRYWNFLLKLDPDRPSPTIQGQPGPWVGPFHWENRRLRLAEVKRLMTFPNDYVIIGSRREQQLQLGNAVPPLLGQVVAEALAEELNELRERDSSSLVASAA